MCGIFWSWISNTNLTRIAYLKYQIKFKWYLFWVSTFQMIFIAHKKLIRLENLWNWIIDRITHCFLNKNKFSVLHNTPTRVSYQHWVEERFQFKLESLYFPLNPKKLLSQKISKEEVERKNGKKGCVLTKNI